MKKPSQFTVREDGVALVLVLAMLVLMSALLVAFVTSAGTENTASKTFAQGLEARQAAETATNLVIAQIREATKADGVEMTWASQPGAIRTFGASRSGNVVYKLYSAEKLQEPESAYRPEDDAGVTAAEGGTLPEGYVDLNEPVMVPVPGDDKDAVEPRFPIVSPYPSFEFDGTKFRLGSTTPGRGAVEGFSCNAIDDPSGRKDINGETVKLLPMPVRWMYVLKDGKITGVDRNGKIIDATKENPPVQRFAFWTDDDCSRLNINTATEGTYWDTPHVSSLQDAGDLNGIQPVQNNGSLNFSVAQPAKGEYQRFPGHPATTCLSPALRWLFRDKPFIYPPKANDPDVEYKEAIYRMAPRVMGGKDSSKAGTVNVKDRTSPVPTAYGPLEKTANQRLWDNDRLYASVDEYFFRPDRTGRDTLQNARFWEYERVDGALAGSTDVANKYFTPDNLEKLRFFLTAHSRAPELNAFGMPRVSVWPVHEDLPKRTAFDDLSAFCATIPGKTSSSPGVLYYILRRNPNSAVEDFDIPSNQRIYKYLQEMTKSNIPFLGRSFLSKYQPANRDQILTEIFDYIRCTNLIDTGVPKAGAQPLARPKPDWDPATTAAEKQYPYSYTRYYWSGGSGTAEGSPPAYGSGQVIPLRIDKKYNPDSQVETKGFGRFPTLAEAAILFFKDGGPNPPQPVKMKAVLLFEMFLPSQGFPGISERYSIRVRPLVEAVNEVGFRVFDGSDKSGPPIPLQFPPDSVNSVEVDAYNAPIGRVFIPFRGFANQFLLAGSGFSTTSKLFGPSPASSPDRRFYPFYSTNENLRISKNQFLFEGGSLEITIYDRPVRGPGGQDTGFQASPPDPVTNLINTSLTSPGGQQIVQQFKIHIPNINNPLPVPTSSVPFATTVPPPPASLPSPGGRVTVGVNGARNSGLNYSAQDNGRSWIEANDVVRSVEVGGIAAGDQRITAGQLIVNDFNNNDETKRFFTRREDNIKKYDSPNNVSATGRLVHGLRLSRGAPYQGYSRDGELVAGAQWRSPYHGQTDNPKPPRVPYAQIGGVMKDNKTPGDWDRGLSKNMSGAFINKADEGNTNFEVGRGNLGIPYFLGYSGFSEAGGSNFSPNRLMPSAVMLGSLPTYVGIDGANGTNGKVKPWETLLFRPENSPGEHPGATDPADHYLLDLFTMPVVEPFAISEPLSTMGKVNLNYQIAPFGYVKVGNRPYIERRTALYGLFKAVKLLLVPKNARWAGHEEDPRNNRENYRYDVDRVKTVDQMDAWLDKHNQSLFRAASEICDVQLYPEGKGNVSDWASFWNQYPLTADNGRERPYAHIYPRATTKSNVFTVYVRAQSIKKSPNSDADKFDDEKDRVTGEYRGSSTIERFLDPNDPAIQRYDPLRNKEGLDKYYRFRVLNTKRFNP
jgi:uncharacterized protein (TIGR02600 family)